MARSKQINWFVPSEGAGIATAQATAPATTGTPTAPTKPTGGNAGANPITGNVGGTLHTTASGTGSGNGGNIVQQHNAGQQGAGQNNWTSPLPGNHGAAAYDLSTAAGAQDYLYSLQAQKPGEFKSQYATQLADLYNQIINRDPFSYDLNGDMLYQNYKDEYMQGGRQAMMDTMGQAAALTGGYGSSYASTAGNQAYQQYLMQLNNIIPQLYDRAYGRYQDEGNELYNRANLTQGLDNTDYSRWSDDYNRFLGERDYALNLQNMLYGREQDDRDRAYNMAIQMAQNGYTPSAELLKTAGLTKADLKKLTQVKSAGSKGGSSGPGPTNNGDPKWKQFGFESEAAYKEWLKKFGKTLGNVKQTLSGVGNALKQGLKDSTIMGQTRPDRLTDGH